MVAPKSCCFNVKNIITSWSLNMFGILQINIFTVSIKKKSTQNAIQISLPELSSLHDKMFSNIQKCLNKLFHSIRPKNKHDTQSIVIKTWHEKQVPWGNISFTETNFDHDGLDSRKKILYGGFVLHWTWSIVLAEKVTWP